MLGAFKEMVSGDKFSLAVGGFGSLCNSMLLSAEATTGGDSVPRFVVQGSGWPIGRSRPDGDVDLYSLAGLDLPVHRRPMVGVRAGEVGGNFHSVFYGVDGMAISVSESGGSASPHGRVVANLGGSHAGNLYADAAT